MQSKSQYWVNDLTHYKPINSNPIWGDYQALFGINQSGHILLLDNKSELLINSPLRERSKDNYYLGIYSWKDNRPELYVLDGLEGHIFNKSFQEALRSLIGVHQIKAGTPVISNTSRKILFYL